jgi:hypothetical protein
VTVGKGKRPRDPNQLAKWIVDQSTSDAPASQPKAADIPAPADISAYMAAIGRKGGLINFTVDPHLLVYTPELGLAFFRGWLGKARGFPGI